jgi:ribosome-associated protein
MKQNPTVREQSLHPEPKKKKAALENKSDAKSSEPLDDRVVAALYAASDKKALDMVVLDLRGIAGFTDYFLIATGTNVRQVQAIADAIVDSLKKEGTRAERIEGYKAAEWVLVDYGDLVVHVFESKARQFYDLERLWRDAAHLALPTDLAAGTNSSLRKEES